MNAKLYISNLSYSTTEDSLKAALSEFGEVTSVRIITDRETGRSRGFGFAEFANADDAKKALDGLNGKDVDGREVRVAEAQERNDRPRGGGGSDSGYGGGNGGGNGGSFRRSY